MMDRKPEIYANFVSVLSIVPNKEDGTLSIRMKGTDNRVYCFDLPEPLVGPLVIGLVSQATALTPSGLTQPMVLNSAKIFTLDDGRAGVELLLENVVRLPVIFPQEAIEPLRNALDKLDELNKKAPTTPKPH